ncbi:hypothetical protein PV08_04997 [Exophiala spinifera]|uniref:Uncharacterized protein n=1 Tax=Exophiala spinifera TaxID=91928 RepID=A0A0D1ZYQ8_9EURO|nr:uncharacterized protein PV08_04997 [Exophiala spinifera]KIW17802.1 hypothetical protein PV08_04997 [Exophiala spinifera]
MSSQSGLDLGWFYDSEEQKHSSVKDFSSTEITRRPWKAFWPPRSGDNFDFWMRSEFPEVLSWQFDPDRPFDQPWRDWLRSLLMKVEAGSCRKRFTSTTMVTRAPTTDFSDDQVTLDLPGVQGATITYLAPLELYKTQKPYFSQLPCGTTLARTNLVESDHAVEVCEIGGREDAFDLDETGFRFMHLPTDVSEWTDESVQSQYLPVISAWLKEYFKCDKVFIYNYNYKTGPVPDRLGGAAYILNYENSVWRCIADADVDAPLAVCDYRSVTPTDLHRIDIVYPHFSEEGFEVTYNPAHRWYYKKRMSKDDIVLFKIDDNLEGVAKFAPHTSFIDPSVSRNTSKRASIEIRAIICG